MPAQNKNLSHTKKIYANYKIQLNNAFEKINLSNIDKACKIIEGTIKSKAKIFVAGNGGSAAVSNHFICDFLKNVKYNSSLKPKIISLSNNVEAIMAISNDLGYDESLSYQAKSLAEPKDAFVILSSSGSSENIINLVKFAKKNKNKVIGISAFTGGFLKKNSDVHIFIKTKDYGVSEDIFQSIMHIIVKVLCFRNKK